VVHAVKEARIVPFSNFELLESATYKKLKQVRDLLQQMSVSSTFMDSLMHEGKSGKRP
jgi:hypothetical protein